MATTKKTPVRRKKTVKSAAATPIVDTKTEAQKKVDELLSGVVTPNEEIGGDKLQEATKEKEGDWVSNQMTALTAKIEELEAANAKLQSENQVLSQKGAVAGGAQKGISMSNSDMKKGIELIFFELDDVFTGAKFGAPFHEAKLKPLLNKVVNTFPFLIDSLKKRRDFMTKLNAKKGHSVARTQY